MDWEILLKKIPEKKGNQKISCIEAEKFIEQFEKIPESKFDNYFMNFFQFNFSNFIDEFFEVILQTELKTEFNWKKYFLILCALNKIYAIESSILLEFFEQKCKKNNKLRGKILILNNYISLYDKKSEKYSLIAFIEMVRHNIISEKKLHIIIQLVKNYFILKKTAEYVVKNYAKCGIYKKVFLIMREKLCNDIICINNAKFNFIMQTKKLPENTSCPEKLDLINSVEFLQKLTEFYFNNVEMEKKFYYQMMKLTICGNLDPCFILKYLKKYDCDETYCIILKNMKKIFNDEIYAKYFKMIIKSYLVENNYKNISEVNNLNLRTTFLLLLNKKAEHFKNINLFDMENYAILKKNRKFLIFYIFENFRNLKNFNFICEKYEIKKTMIKLLIKAIVLLGMNGEMQMMFDYTEKLKELTDRKEIFDFLCNYAIK